MARTRESFSRKFALWQRKLVLQWKVKKGTHKCARSSQYVRHVVLEDPLHTTFFRVCLLSLASQNTAAPRGNSCVYFGSFQLWNWPRDVVCCWVLRRLNVTQPTPLRVMPRRHTPAAFGNKTKANKREHAHRIIPCPGLVACSVVLSVWCPFAEN